MRGQSALQSQTLSHADLMEQRMAEHFVGQTAGEHALAGFIPIEREHLPKAPGLLWVVEKGRFAQLQLTRFAVQQRDAAERELFRAEIQVGQANVAVDHPAGLVLGRQDAQFVRATLVAGLVTAKGPGAAGDVAREGVVSRRFVVLGVVMVAPQGCSHAVTALGDGMAAALWSNHHDAQDYEAPTHHTLSCYIAGGTGTFRRDQPGTKGGPDKLCILPAEHQSAWVINGEIRLAHVYFSPEQFALGCVTLLDREPRELQLRESTFLEDASQARRFHQLIALNWHEPAERLLTSSLAHEMLSHTLLS